MQSRLRKFLAFGTATLVGLLGLQVFGAFAASAHTPSASVSCTAWSISGTNYDNTGTNTYSYSIDGATAVTGSFGSGGHFGPFTGTFAVGSGNHTLVGHVYADGQPPPKQYSVNYNLSSSNCVAYVDVPAAPTPIPPTCSAAGSATVPANTDKVHWTLDGHVATATAQGNNAFPGGATTKTFTETVLPKLDPNSDGCATHNTAAAPVFTNGDCTSVPTLSGATDGTGYTVAVTGTPGFGNTVTVTFAALPNYRLDGTTTYTFTYAARPDCRTVVIPVQPAVTQASCNPATGVDSGFSITPATTSGISYSLDGLVVTATANENSKLGTLPSGWTGNDTSATYTVTRSDPSCLIDVSPVTPTVVQSECAVSGPSPTSPTMTLADTASVTYTVPDGPYLAGGSALVTATAAPGHTFEQAGMPSGWTLDGPSTSATQAKYTVVFEVAPQCAVATEPTFANDVCTADGATGSTLTLPATTGVDYLVDGTTSVAGSYVEVGGSTVTVTAQPQTGYTLVGATSWTHQYDADPKCTSVKAVILHHPKGGAPTVSSVPVVSTLPFTGAPTSELARLGGLVIAAGLALCIGARRRRTATPPM